MALSGPSFFQPYFSPVPVVRRDLPNAAFLPFAPSFPPGLGNWPSPRPTPPPITGPLSQWQQTASLRQTPLDRAIIAEALRRLGTIVNPPYDDAYLRRTLGVIPPFRNGGEALGLLLSRGVRVEFGDMGDSPAHAEWQSDRNRIVLNARYRNDTSPATLYALSEAVYHETGHVAGNGDGQSSIQEELNCLALNTLGYRCHTALDSAYAAAASASPLIANGVALYSRLFFDPDPAKRALIRRVIEKYGNLPLTSPGHGLPLHFSPLALRVRDAKRTE
jgi:hypothetical protein